ncbi:mannitol-1-phosphate/altronate dehydrogenase [Devosia sp. UYZn731]|uniref:mannitol dehydrogenase family protein n=1 Tax=Devosia sp. UYZn731 TaxID=3156345 RepID=UPI003395E513
MPNTITLDANALVRLPEPVNPIRYDRRRLVAGIAHIGVGNFHRAHEALYIHRCLELGQNEDWAIVGIGMGIGAASAQKAEDLIAQDCLYTLTEYATNGTSTCSVIGSIIEYLHAPDNPEAAVERIADPHIRIVSLTITEGGYNLDESSGAFLISTPSIATDLLSPEKPLTPFGLIVQALRLRRDRGMGGLTVMSCDNLRSNGIVSRRAVLGYATALDPELAAWIDENVSFPNSMVDRIAPSVGPAEIARANTASGIADRSPVVGESFTQWVIEDKFIAGRPPLEKVGVELRPDVEQFETIKGRMLNASHMMMSYPSLLCGHRLVDEAMRDENVVGYLNAFLEVDVIPRLTGPEGVSLQEYKDMVIDRFANKAVGDQLLRIAHNGIAKLPIFLSKTLTELTEENGDLRRVSHCLACFETYLTGRSALPVNEPLLTATDKTLLDSGDPLALLKLSAFSALGLDASPSFAEAFTIAQNQLAQLGPQLALAATVRR